MLDDFVEACAVAFAAGEGNLRQRCVLKRFSAAEKPFYFASVNDFGDELSVMRTGNLHVFLGRRNGSGDAVLGRFSNHAHKLYRNLCSCNGVRLRDRTLTGFRTEA